jgi:glycosyltransferase involved in cell wall biosynthesis
MAKLSIALCITDLDIGGAERAVADLATRLDRNRFAPVVYCLGPRPAIEAASCAPPLEKAGIEVHFLGGQRKRDLPNVVRRLGRLLVEHRTDLVQSFLFHANLAARLAARRAGIRPVVSGIRVAERQQRWHLWADRLTSRWVDRYVCVSRSVAEFSIHEAGLPEGKLVVIPNGIDPRACSAAQPADLRPLGIRPDQPLVTYVGRLDPQKGLAWLLSASPQWLQRSQDCDLLLVGRGPERPELERLAASSGFHGRIHFAGWRADVPEILAASRLLVLPSQWEGMPNVVLQAMASGLPVVATDVEGVRELLGPEANSQMVPYGDSQALSERICGLLADRSQAEELGRRNRLRAETEFTLERTVAAYQDLWQSLARADFAG